jgi:hypothetical protein
MQLCQPNAPLKNVMNILEEDMNLKNRCKGKKMMKESCIVIFSGSCPTKQLHTVSSKELGLLKGFLKFCQRTLDDNLALVTTPSSHIISYGQGSHIVFKHLQWKCKGHHKFLSKFCTLKVTSELNAYLSSMLPSSILTVFCKVSPEATGEGFTVDIKYAVKLHLSQLFSLSLFPIMKVQLHPHPNQDQPLLNAAFDWPSLSKHSTSFPYAFPSFLMTELTSAKLNSSVTNSARKAPYHF